MLRTKLSRERQQHGALSSLRRVTGLGALTLFLSGCGATHSVSQGDPAIESSALREPQPFTRLAPRTYTPDEWLQALRADVYLPANNPNGTLRSAALVVDEGGWRNRTPEDMQGIAEQLAGQG